MADRPLRPATDRSLGGPLPHQQANRTRAHPKAQKLWPPKGHHPVLAAVSSGCPGPWGRFPRVTHPCATRSRAEARPRVRLACVKRAASVRSEPGSNSQLHPAQASLPADDTPLQRTTDTQRLTRSPCASSTFQHHHRLRQHHLPAPDPQGSPPDAQAQTTPSQRPPPAHPFLLLYRFKQRTMPPRA